MDIDQIGTDLQGRRLMAGGRDEKTRAAVGHV
jgi:hypothetical protein